MKNEAVKQLECLVGDWKLTMTNAWFLESLDVKGEGSATIGGLGDAFIELPATLGEQGTWHWVIGRSDPREQLVLLYHDERGVLRVFDMTIGDGQWTLLRDDPISTSDLSRPWRVTASTGGGRRRRTAAARGGRTST